MSSETPRIRSRWRRVDDGRLGQLNALCSQPLLPFRVELHLLDRRLELGLNSLAGVPRHERRVLTHDVLRSEVGLLLLFVAGDVELGIGLQERAAIGAQLLAGELLLDHASVGRLKTASAGLPGLSGGCSMCSSSSETCTPALADSFLQLGNEQGDIGRRFPTSTAPRTARSKARAAWLAGSAARYRSPGCRASPAGRPA